MGGSIQVYSAIVGTIDYPRNDIKVFTDLIDVNHRRSARKYKTLSHKYVDADYSIWIDGNLELKLPSEQIIEELGEFDIATIVHPIRDCVYQEAEAVKQLNKDLPEIVDAQMNRYRLEGYPEHNGMVASSMVVRRHTDRIKELNEAWWNEIKNGSQRDQLSFNYVCWKLGIKYKLLSGEWQNNKYYTYNQHYEI